MNYLEKDGFDGYNLSSDVEEGTFGDTLEAYTLEMVA